MKADMNAVANPQGNVVCEFLRGATENAYEERRIDGLISRAISRRGDLISRKALRENSEPTIDVVEVVRCRDCKNASRIERDHTDKMRHCRSGRGSDAGDGFSRVSRDGFCDEGVRERRATPEVET